MNSSIVAVAPKVDIPQAANVFLGLLKHIKVGHLHLITPQGTRLEFGNAHSEPPATLIVRDWRACALILKSGDIGFAEAWRDGWCDSPNLTALLHLAQLNEATLQSMLFGGKLGQLWYGLRHLLRRNSRSGSKRNIHAHYDLGNAFYQLWLDPSMTYSSAWFAGDLKGDLVAAQAAKYQRIIDELGIRPGSRVLEIGCGWGGFAEQAARQGIHVHGITLSPAQLEFAQARINAAGLSDKVTLSLTDYRDLNGQYDHVVSIEMFEAVGERYWRGYFAKVKEVLRSGGSAMIQTITIADERFAKYRATADFIQQFIFPGGMLPSPSRFSQAAERAGLLIQDEATFGRDYAETLRRWRTNVDLCKNEILQQGFDDVFLRIWHMYLCYCEAGFDGGQTDVYQYHLVKH